MIRTVFFGTPHIAATILGALIAHPQVEIAAVVTQPDRPAGRGKKLSPSPVKELALLHSLPVLQPERIKRDEQGFISSLTAHGPVDIGIVVAFGQILPLSVLNYPRKGCLNIHASLLPRWRGAAPIQRAIMSGDTTTGVCLMQMDQGLDTGPVFSRSEITITPEDSFGTMHDKIAESGAALLVKDLEAIVSGSLLSIPQSEEGATYAKKIENHEAQINWQEPITSIVNLIRGLSPVPTAFTTLNGQRLKLYRARQASPRHAISAAPGTVVHLDRSSLEIACADGTALAIEEAQLEGRKRLPVHEFLNGTTISVGTVLG